MIDNEQETKNNYIKYIKIVFYMIKITTKNIEKNYQMCVLEAM